MRAHNFSTSDLIIGMIEDIEINNIRLTDGLDHRQGSATDVNELAWSIKNKGLLQPIIVRTKNDHYEVVAGNRRLSACKMLGWKKIVCHVVSLTDKEAYEVSLVENVQRKTLTPLQEAKAFERYVTEFGWGGISDLASKIGKSVSYIDKRLKLLGLPRDIVESLSDSSINTSVAEELIPVKDLDVQSRIAKMARENKLSSRKVRSLVSGFIEDGWNVNKNLKYDESDEAKNKKSEAILQIDERTQRTFDKAILTLRVAMSKIVFLTENVEDDWILYETFMHHKNVLHSLIDLLIKEKKKF